MKPWRLVIEFGDPANSGFSLNHPVALPPSMANEVMAVSAPDTAVRDTLWTTLKEARGNLKAAIMAGDTAKIEQVNSWIGGGLAAMALLLREDPDALQTSLAREVPVAPVVPPEEMTEAEKRATFVEVKRERPPKHPGAPRPLDPADLSPEEREELGIVLPGEEVVSKVVDTSTEMSSPASSDITSEMSENQSD